MVLVREALVRTKNPCFWFFSDVLSKFEICPTRSHDVAKVIQELAVEVLKRPFNGSNLDIFGKLLPVNG
jgi:hypothetical protein